MVMTDFLQFFEVIPNPASYFVIENSLKSLKLGI